MKNDPFAQLGQGPIDQKLFEKPQKTSIVPTESHQVNDETTRQDPIKLHHDTTVDTKQPRNHDTMQPSYQSEIIETVRKALVQVGKEAATYRFTREEKKALGDIVYTFKTRDSDWLTN